MFAQAVSCAVRGLTGFPVVVEADISSGLPGFTIVGLTDRAIQEARERVKAAVRNAGFEFPGRKLTVNLAPAELPKEGTGFDLAIAIAVMVCAGRRLPLQGTAMIGELALDASLRPVAGVLPMARCLRGAGVRRLVVPYDNAAEAALVEGLEVVAAPSLQACVLHLDGSRPLPPVDGSTTPVAASSEPDLAEVRGQASARRTLEIAAAGGHNLLMLGPPGSGKTMLAHAFPSLLPDLDAAAALDVAAVYSLRGSFRDRTPSSVRPPFRAPHHSISRAGLVGGGSGIAQPGEVSLATHGALFLDEVCEFPRALLEALRQPLEDRSVSIVRARGAVSFPADFLLVAAANPCPCGHAGDPVRPCRCDPRDLTRYRTRLSGPVRDRIDLRIDVPRQTYDDLFDPGTAPETSAAVRGRVEAARRRQTARQGAGVLNAALRATDLHAACRVTPSASALLAMAGERLGLSARAFHRVLRVARTIADLGDEDAVSEEALAEALRHRGEEQR